MALKIESNPLLRQVTSHPWLPSPAISNRASKRTGLVCHDCFLWKLCPRGAYYVYGNTIIYVGHFESKVANDAATMKSRCITWVSDKQDPLSLLPASLSDLQTDRHSFFCTPGSQLCGDSASLKKRRGEDWSKMKQGCVSNCAVCALNKGIRIKGHYLHCRRHRITPLFWSFSSREEYLILIKIFI